ncbi:MAG: hypothetical protein KAH57_09865 [Thermoplasmata archaeon]|nr:hypothetical protein [Thermoplasmata archaeon]
MIKGCVLMDPDESSWREPIRAAIVQTELKLGDIDVNLSRARDIIDDMKGSSDLLIFPEMFSSGFAYDDLEEIATRSPDVIRFMKGVSIELSAHLMFTMAERDGGHVVNRAYLMGPDGDVLGHYDKTHLFSPAGEDVHFKGGDELNMLHMGQIRMGPLICYEIRYPEMSRKYALDGAHILVYMAQWPAKRIFQWELLLRARAVENQCFVIGSNICGLHGSTEMGGHSMIVSPFGEVLTSLEGKAGWASSELDPERMYRFRRGIPAMKYRRPELYHNIDRSNLI